MTYIDNFERIPTLSFLLIDDDLVWSNSFKRTFSSYKEAYEKLHKVNINIISIDIDLKRKKVEDKVKINILDNKCNNPGEIGLKLLHNPDLTSDVQGILLDWELSATLEKIELIREILKIRPIMPIYIITQNKDEEPFIDEELCPFENIFYKSDIEGDIHDVIQRLLSDFNRKKKSPFWEEYKKYILASVDTWHTPGHCGGISFRKSDYIQDFYDFFHDNVFKGDLSVSVETLGSLLDGTSYILAAQEKAAKTFGSKHTFFVTNGSSTANKILIQSVLRPNDSVIVDRNCHKSVHYGVIQSGAIPHYLESEYDSHYGIFAPPKLESIKKVIESTNSKLLILTGCTYEGILSDIKSIVKYCHKYRVKVMIDEAWFAYSRFHPNYIKYSAIEAGADYVTHSSHKTLSAFSQASMIHVNDDDFDEDYFREIFYIYTSTSPQYQIIASLDVAATQMRMEGYKMLSFVLRLADKFRNHIKNLKYFNLVDEKNMKVVFPHLKMESIGFDRLKVLIDFSNTGLSASEVLKKIRFKAKLEIEKYTHSTFLVLFTIGTKEEKITRLLRALKNIEGKINPKTIKIKQTPASNLPKGIKLKKNMTPAIALFGEREKIHISNANNRISAGLVTPYPPGIPLLVPAQIINQQHIDYIINELIPNNLEVHGLFDGYIYVIKE